MGPFKVLTAVLVGIFLLSQSMYATPPNSNTLSFEGEILVEGDLKAGEIVTITFNFKLLPLGDTYERLNFYFDDLTGFEDSVIQDEHKLNLQDYHDTAYIYAGDEFEFITPNSWSGRLKPDKLESITAKAVVKSKPKNELIGIVGAFCDLFPVDSLKRQPDCYSLNSVAIEDFYDKQPEQFDSTKFDTIKSDSGDGVFIRNIINNSPPPESELNLGPLRDFTS